MQENSMNTNWWRSSFCASGTCVDVAVDGERVNVRDSHGTVIEFRADIWKYVVDDIKYGFDYPGPWIRPVGAAVEWVGMPPGRTETPVTLRFDTAEWTAFTAGVRAGEFDGKVLNDAHL